MLRDGIYRVTYAYAADGPITDQALAIVRDGRVVASDRHGGVYVSGPPDNTTSDSSVYTISASIPPGGELATGFQAGDGGAHIVLKAVTKSDADKLRAIIDIDGKTLEADFIYLSPLPT